MASEYTDIMNKAWALTGSALLAMAGGAVAYLRSKRDFSWKTFGIELASSGFSGVLAYWLCEAAGITGPAAAVAIGAAGHGAGSFLAALKSKQP